MRFFLSTFLLFFTFSALAQVQGVVPGKYTPGFYSSPNFVKNPNCFANNRNITVSGTGTVTRTTSTPLEGPASCSIAGSSSGDRVSFDTNTLDQSLKNQMCEAVIVYSGDGSKWQLYARSNSTNISPLKQLSNTFNSSLGSYDSYTAAVPYPCGDLTQAASPVIEATASSPATIKVTAVYLGVIVNKVSDLVMVSPWQSYTPTFTGFGTVSTSNCKHRQNGSSREIECTFVTGTPTAVEARVSLPSGDTSSSDYPTLSVARGYGADTGTGELVIPLIEPSVTYLTFGRGNSGAANLVKATGSGGWSAGVTLSFYASVRVQNLAPTVSMYSGSCGTGCIDKFSARVSFGTVTRENADWINGNCTSASPNVCTFNTGIFTTAPNCTVSTEQGGTLWNEGFQVTAISSSSVSVQYVQTSANTATTGGDFVISCQKTGADFIATRTITGTFKENVTTPGLPKPVLFSAGFGGASEVTLCSSTPCTLYNNKGGYITSVTRSGTGSYVANFTGLNSAPSCTVQMRNFSGSTALSYSPSATTSSAFSVTVVSGSGTAIDAAGTIVCHGDIQ